MSWYDPVFRMITAVRALVRARPSLVIWASIAVGVVVFSYIFTLMLAVACAYLPLVLLSSMSSISYQVVLLSIAGIIVAVTIIWSVLPRRDRFRPPGPILSPDTQPRLFSEIEQIAAAFEEPVPGGVYLTAELNAWVARRGGFMGVGSRRVMGIGLPLMQVLTISQFRAVLAHEFGHYYEGDTRLGPWIFSARAAMARTLENLGGNSSLVETVSRFQGARLVLVIVMAVLNAYWKLFIRITQFVSRKQEFRADELACAVAGPEPMIAGLKTLAESAPALREYWFTEVVPSLEAGYRPPFAEGFGQFLSAPHVAAAAKENLTKVLAEEATAVDDTHPPLRDRIAAIDALTLVAKPEICEGATTLLEDLDGLEVKVISQVAPELDAKRLKPLGWADAGREAYVPIWRKMTSEHGQFLDSLTICALPETLNRIPELSATLRDPPGRLFTREQRAQRAANVLWMALALALVDHGWQVRSEPGRFCLFSGDQEVNPITKFGELQSGEMSAAGWREWAEGLDISQIPLNSKLAAGAA